MTGEEAWSPPVEDAAAFWEARYTGSDRIWSGRVNTVLAAEAATLKPGTALDLGCGEGADSVWLAAQGWLVTGVDIAETAIARARQFATEEGVSADQIRWVVADLATWRPERTYDLVSACFLQSPFAFPRTEVLRRAAAAVGPEGHLLIVGHAAAPPWARQHEDHDHELLSADEELAGLHLPVADWEVVRCENRPRAATGPDGEEATLDDAVIVARRRANG